MRYTLSPLNSEYSKQLIEFVYLDKGYIQSFFVEDYSYFDELDFNRTDLERFNSKFGSIVATKSFKDNYKLISHSLRMSFENKAKAMRKLGFD